MVFGAWASWTDDYDEYVADTENKNFCAYEPMMYAFVILIIKWVGDSRFQIKDCSDLPTLLGPDPLHDGPHLLLWVPVCLLLRCLCT